jgi:hypothetical protein
MCKLIKLTQNKYAIVDDEDYDDLIKWKWFATKQAKTYYAVRTARLSGKQTTIRMHRYLLNAQTGDEIDHKNNNGLDNRRKNIRFCTSTQNKGNCRKYTSIRYGNKYKGVKANYKRSKNNPWAAVICYKGKGIYIGVFKTEEEAALAYNKKAIELFGEFAKINKIEYP